MTKRSFILIPVFLVFLFSLFSFKASIPSIEIESCEQIFVTVSGKVVDIQGNPIENATVYLDAELIEYPRARDTDENGFYSFDKVAIGNTFEISVRGGVKYTKYLSTLDYVLIIRHMLGLEKHLDHPYKIIAADTNADNKLTALDLEDFQHVALGVLPKFPRNKIIRYVNADYNFADPKNPWPDENGSPFITTFKPTEDTTFGFVGIRTGNVSQNLNW